MDDLESAYRRTALIGGVMAASLVTYVLVAVMLHTLQDGFAGFWSDLTSETVEQLGYGLLAVCVAALAVIHFLKARFTSSPAATGAAPDREALICRLVSTHVAAFALAESMAVLGFVFFLLTGATTEFFVFLGFSAVAFTYAFPRYRQWQEWLGRRAVTL